MFTRLKPGENETLLEMTRSLFLVLITSARLNRLLHSLRSFTRVVLALPTLNNSFAFCLPTLFAFIGFAGIATGHRATRPDGASRPTFL